MLSKQQLRPILSSLSHVGKILKDPSESACWKDVWIFHRGTNRRVLTFYPPRSLYDPFEQARWWAQKLNVLRSGNTFEGAFQKFINVYDWTRSFVIRCKTWTVIGPSIIETARTQQTPSSKSDNRNLNDSSDQSHFIFEIKSERGRSDSFRHLFQK